jgi:hypothetical protein
MKMAKKNEYEKFELIKDGCLYMSTEATSFKAARADFAEKYYGNYEILRSETGERRKVRL